MRDPTKHASRSLAAALSAPARRSAAEILASHPAGRCLCRRRGAAVAGLTEGKDYRTLRFNSDLGKHGDTGTSEAEVVRAVLDGRADAGAIGSPFWRAVQTEQLVPAGALTEIWTSPPYNHCMFTARPDLEEELQRQFAEALSGMSYDNPNHRMVLDAEGLRRWVAPQLEGYETLREASARQGFFKSRPAAAAQA